MPMLQRKNNVRIGIAGWSYPDWKRIVYPARRGLNKLKYMAQFFQAIEINAATGKSLPTSPGHFLKTVLCRRR